MVEVLARLLLAVPCDIQSISESGRSTLDRGLSPLIIPWELVRGGIALGEANGDTTELGTVASLDILQEDAALLPTAVMTSMMLGN